MIRDLRKEGAPYQRPNQKWQCGGSCHECHFGPSAKGKCQAISECSPISDGDDGWKCSRTQLLGGSCHCGPTTDGNCGLSVTKCQPKRSLRWWRGRLTLAMTLMTVGVFCVLFSRPNSNELLAPGPLSGTHAQIMKGENRCASCHGAGNKSLLAWLGDAFTGGKTIPPSQTDLCMKCHNDSIDSRFAKNPHNFSLEALALLTEKSRRSAGQNTNASFMSGGHSEIACSACHREHHGTDDLKILTDQQCQTCHNQSFDHFASSHPEFSSWPNPNQQTINFDHNSHAMKHFGDKNMLFDCSSCHKSDSFGNVQLLETFENSCAECHGDSIRQSGGDGWALFALPMIDQHAIQNSMTSIGSWPSQATGDFDGELPAIMRVLLAADTHATAALNRLGPDFQFGDVDPDDEDQVRDTTTVLWGIKLLLWEFSVKGKEVIRTRLNTILDTEVTDHQLRDLTTGLDFTEFNSAQARWLPNLEEEILEYQRTGLPPKKLSYVPGSDDDVARMQFGGKTQDSEILAENPLKNKTAIERPGAPATELPKSLNPAQAQGKQRPASRIENSHVQDAQAQRFEIPRANNDELLIENPLKALLQGQRPNVPIDSNASVNPSDGNPSESNSGTTESQIAKLETALAAAIRSQEGRWYRDDQSFSISYRHSGHADRYLKSWSEIAVQAKRSGIETANDLFKKVTSPLFQGQCASCHNIDPQSSTLAWQPNYRDPAFSKITKFSHSPHLTQPELRDCKQCHELTNASVGQGLVSFSDFQAIKKSNCVSCHQPGGAESSCATCHSYHVHPTAQQSFKAKN